MFLKLNEIEKSSWNNEVSKQLDIGDSTLRKWCIELEENGYTFVKGTKGTRAFTENDLVALLYFKYLTRAKNHTMKQAAVAVVEKYSKEGENKSHSEVPVGSLRSDLQEMLKDLLEHAKRQEEFNNSLLERLEMQDRYIKEILDSLKKEQKQIKNEERTD